jgi:hypothetical protein
LGGALEKMAALTTGGGQPELFNQALDNYLDVINENEYNKKNGLSFDEFWRKKAYLQAAPLVGILYDADRQKNFYMGMEKALPQLADLIEKKIDSLSPQKN